VTRIHALVLAGGAGSRFGPDLPKQFIRLAGAPILLRTLRTVRRAGCDAVVVVANPEWLTETQAIVSAMEPGVPISVVAGGPTRNESTRRGLAALGDAADDDIVIVHDAVRPLVPLEVITRSIEPVRSGAADAADVVIPSADTLVEIEADRVVRIPDRSRFRRGQTPQTFRLGVLRRAYAAASAAGDLSATDDCTLVLRYVPEARMVAVAGDEINIKITTRLDLVIADRMIQMRTLSANSADAGALSDLEGSAGWVVGGTGGIGQAIARVAAASGMRVVVDGRSTGLDIRDYEAVARRAREVAAELGRIDHVVCTAGVLRTGLAMSTPTAALAEIIDVNVTGSLNVARATHPLLAAHRGSLTLFASSSFTVGRPGYVAYSASKAAVVNLAQGLAEEWAADGIRVNAVSPERTATAMRLAAFPDESPDALLDPDEVARATLRLMASELTGQVLDVRRDDFGGPGELAGPGDMGRPDPG